MVKDYIFREFRVRAQMMGAIHRYIEDKLYPGSFLQAIISNNLKEAVGCADDDNLRNIPAFVSYFYNEAPLSCRGSEEIMASWIKGKEKGKEVSDG